MLLRLSLSVKRFEIWLPQTYLKIKRILQDFPFVMNPDFDPFSIIR